MPAEDVISKTTSEMVEMQNQNKSTNGDEDFSSSLYPRQKKPAKRKKSIEIPRPPIEILHDRYKKRNQSLFELTLKTASLKKRATNADQQQSSVAGSSKDNNEDEEENLRRQWIAMNKKSNEQQSSIHPQPIRHRTNTTNSEKSSIHPRYRPRMNTTNSENIRRRLSVVDVVRHWKHVTIASTVQPNQVVRTLDSMLKPVNFDIFIQAKRARILNIKCMWLFLSILMMSVLFFEIYRNVERYKNNPALTTFTIYAPDKMHFPRIYICMANNVNWTFMKLHSQESNLAKGFRERIVTVNNRKKRSAAEFIENDINFFENDDDDEYLINAQETYFDRFLSKRSLESFHLLLNNSNITQNQFDPYKYFRNAAFNLNDTFLDCRFRSYQHENLDCSKIVRPLLDVNYGICYLVDVGDRQQTRAGKGLTLLLNAHVDLYPKDGNAPRASGIYVTVHKDYDPTNWHISCALPGRLTKIDLAATRIKLLNLESGRLIQPCVSPENGAEKLKIFNVNYTRTACQMDCMIRKFKEICECVLLADKSIIRDDALLESDFCTPNRSRECLVPNVTRNTRVQEEISQCRNSCHTPCDSWRYGMRVSSSQLYAPAFTNRWNLSKNNMRENLIQLDIAFSSIEYSELVQSPSATFTGLVAAIGGQVNLWLGASIVAMIQILAFIIGFAGFKAYEFLIERLSANHPRV